MPHAPIDCPPTGNDDFDNADWSKVPHHLREGLHEYIRTGRSVGGFLTAVLSNDLAGAVTRADPGSMGSLKAVIHFLQFMPADCHGSREKVDKWVFQRGIIGQVTTFWDEVPRGHARQIAAADRVIDANGVIVKDRDHDTPRPLDNAGDPDIVLDLRQPPGRQMTTRAERQLMAMVPEGTKIVMIDTINDGDDHG